MEPDEITEGLRNHNISDDDDSRATAVNSVILDYYKKFGKKRDLEQFFSLSTAQSEIRDPSSLFWRRMKSQTDSSDSVEKKRDSPTELCRISIRCSVPEQTNSKKDSSSKNKSDSESPPIITEDVQPNVSRQSDEESAKSDDNNSHKSADNTLDTSMNKPFSPTSSITSQRKLEWDSLADVGYANESDRKTSASTLSTLERLALQQHYSNNDMQSNINLGPPTAHSTPLETLINPNTKLKVGKKGAIKKTTEIHSKDIDVVQLNLPHTSKNTSQPININLTKHISFNVEKDGGITMGSTDKEVKVESQKTNNSKFEVTPEITFDKEIQTSLTRSVKNDESHVKEQNLLRATCDIPVIVSLNTLRRRIKRRRFRTKRKNNKKKAHIKKNDVSAVQEKSGEQVSDAESFEYMPGHIYNQNKIQKTQQRDRNLAGNKSSLESSGAVTTESSKSSLHSFTKDLEKSIDLLRAILHKRNRDSDLKKTLIKEVVQKLLNTKYKDDETTTDVLSGLSFGSKRLGLTQGEYKDYTTTSSEANNSGEKTVRPKKSILRSNRLNIDPVPSTSQSAPNLVAISSSEKPEHIRTLDCLIASQTGSDISNKGKESSDADTPNIKTSSEELYQKYIDAFKIEEAYKNHLRKKEKFLKLKLVGSESAVQPSVSEARKNKLKELINDLTRNNYDDGSGDASKLELGSNFSNPDKFSDVRIPRTHSVFTLSSGNSDKKEREIRKVNLRYKLHEEINSGGTSNDGVKKPLEHPYCCCPHHNPYFKVTDSSVQVNIQYDQDEGLCVTDKTGKRVNVAKAPAKHTAACPNNTPTIMPDRVSDEIKYVCLCTDKHASSTDMPDNFLIYKCSRLENTGIQLGNTPSTTSNTIATQCGDFKEPHFSLRPVTMNNAGLSSLKDYIKVRTCNSSETCHIRRTSQSSQTNIALSFNAIKQKPSDKSVGSGTSSAIPSNKASPRSKYSDDKDSNKEIRQFKEICECTRWIQTEISIDPLISEPTISDINIVNNKNCAGLIGKEYRKMPLQAAITGIDSPKSKFTNQLQKENIKGNVAPMKINDEEFLRNQNLKCTCNKQSSDSHTCTQEVQSNLDMAQEQPLKGKTLFGTSHAESTKNLPDSYAIPLHGTNMTVMVRIDAKDQNSQVAKERNQHVSAGVGTDKMEYIEQATSLTEECSRGCQSQNTNVQQVLQSIKITSDHFDCKSNKSSCTDRSGLSENRNNDPRFVSTCFTCNDSAKFSTYPNAEKKQFLRTNTDPKIYAQGFGVTFKDQTPEQELQIWTACEQPSLKNKTCKQAGKSLEEYESYKTIESVSTCCSKKSAQRANNSTQQPCCESEKRSASCGKSCTEESPLSPISSRKADDYEESCSKSCSDKSDQKIKRSENMSATNSSKCDQICGTSESSRQSTKSCKQVKDETEETPNSSDKKIIKGANERTCCSNKAIDNGGQSTKSCKQVKDETKETPNLSDKKIIKGANERTCCSKKAIDNVGCAKATTSCGKSCNCESPRLANTVIEASKYECSSKDIKNQRTLSQKSSDSENRTSDDCCQDPVLDLIKDITRRYSKTNIEKDKRKKCFKEIMTVLNYLLDTDDNIDLCDKSFQNSPSETDKDCASNDDEPVKENTMTSPNKEKTDACCEKSPPRKLVDKAIQLCRRKSRSSHCPTESSDVPLSSEIPCTSSDSATCKVLNKIRKECEKYHQKRKCTHGGGKKCEASSSTSINCDSCHRVHQCSCRCKCRGYRPTKSMYEKIKKKCVAYNLIVQSDSLVSEETLGENKRLLRNIIVKVPSRRTDCIPENMTYLKEASAKIEKDMRSQYCHSHTANIPKCHRSRSLPNDVDVSSPESYCRQAEGLTVREYLEKNRPDFIKKTSNRQDCLKLISETRASERDAQRELLSLRLDRQPAVNDFDLNSLRRFAKEIGVELRRRKIQPKFISEHEMKKHSEKIYKSLPEVQKKKEEVRKEKIKKTNLLMASIFRKNLQKKTLQGTVNLSNYSPVIKI